MDPCHRSQCRACNPESDLPLKKISRKKNGAQCIALIFQSRRSNSVLRQPALSRTCRLSPRYKQQTSGSYARYALVRDDLLRCYILGRFQLPIYIVCYHRYPEIAISQAIRCAQLCSGACGYLPWFHSAAEVDRTAQSRPLLSNSA